MTDASMHLAQMRNPDRHTALLALSELEETIATQGIAFERDAVTCIPLTLDLALDLNEDIAIRAELLQYLANIHGSALWTWRRIRAQTAPEDQPEYNEMVTWEESVAADYEARFPAAVSLIARSNDARVRGGAVSLASHFSSRRRELLTLMQRMFDEVAETPLKLDFMEGVANLGITLDAEGDTHRQALDWIEERRHDDSPVVRLGATLSLLARADEELRAPLEHAAASATQRDRSAVMEAMWLYDRSVGWAITRKLS